MFEKALGISEKQRDHSLKPMGNYQTTISKGTKQ
jgi:hypothetical protein